jgi:hypothetical protein
MGKAKRTSRPILRDLARLVQNKSHAPARDYPERVRRRSAQIGRTPETQLAVPFRGVQSCARAA